MYVTAHRVRRPSSGAEGINAFLHTHGGCEWEAPPAPEHEPGELIDSIIDPIVPPPGNRVRSYIDVVAPDGTPTQRILNAFTEVVAFEPRALPFEVRVGDVWFRASMEDTLAAAWQPELALLMRYVVALLQRR